MCAAGSLQYYGGKMLFRTLKQVISELRPRRQPSAIVLATIRSAFELGDLGAAEQAVDAVLAGDPAHIEALFYRGLIDFRRRSFVSALAAFRRAAKCVPASPDYQYRMATCCYMLGDSAQARILCEAALKLHPDFVHAHTMLAQLSLPGPNYTDVLTGIHRRLAPRTYLEIGVATGATIALAGADTAAIGVDPEPKLVKPLGSHVRIFPLTSDEFFKQHDVAREFGDRPVDLAFIDGMHHFEFALRDFIAIERYCTSSSTVLLHDCCPLNRETAERERITTFWSGDIWRLVLALKKYRPDLSIHTIAAAPTGLTIVRNLDAGSHILSERMDEIVSEFLAVDYSVLDADKPGALNLFPNDWLQIESLLAEA